MNKVTGEFWSENINGRNHFGCLELNERIRTDKAYKIFYYEVRVWKLL
jgi:hypothetical protein